ncbi:MAG: GNAT family N-acetyltransferase, partial [Actinomyces graevenitzii]|nr:GNAT family N-acetyltransferase [Actinomyces graevenitzii]
LVDQDSVYLFVFRTDKPVTAADGNEVEAGTILGMLSLATFAIPTGVRAWVEDVVVDAGTRGMGAGQQLVEAAVAHAQKIGARTVDLTSRPSREAANRLYRRCGFELRETNVYRYASN